LDYLNGDTDTGEKAFISNLFEHITLYDLKTTDVVVTERDDGQFDIKISINASLMRADGQGVEVEEDFTEMIDIGLFSADPEDLSAENIVQYINKHEIKTGENIIMLTVKEKPKYVGVDPFVRLIDRDSADNIYRL
jgi:ABC-2 type transport system permease protein